MDIKKRIGKYKRRIRQKYHPLSIEKKIPDTSIAKAETIVPLFSPMALWID